MINLDKAASIINDFKNLKGGLLECLHGLQHYFGYVPQETIDVMADAFNLSRAEVHGVISYYHDFKNSPQGRRLVRVCQAEACQAMGSSTLTEHMKQKLGLDMGQTDDQGDYTLDAVYCFGNCALSPNIEIDGKLYGRASIEKFDAIINKGEQ